jgi:hypothetical protein
MNANFNTPISITLTQAKLVYENQVEGVGTIEFQIEEQPIHLLVATTSYSYNTNIQIGDRVKLIVNFSTLGVGSNGILQQIYVDPTQDRAMVFFDNVLPNQDIFGSTSLNIYSGIIRLEIQVPFAYLAKV